MDSTFFCFPFYSSLFHSLLSGLPSPVSDPSNPSSTSKLRESFWKANLTMPLPCPGPWASPCQLPEHSCHLSRLQPHAQHAELLVVPWVWLFLFRASVFCPHSSPSWEVLPCLVHLANTTRLLKHSFTVTFPWSVSWPPWHWIIAAITLGYTYLSSSGRSWWVFHSSFPARSLILAQDRQTMWDEWTYYAPADKKTWVMASALKELGVKFRLEVTPAKSSEGTPTNVQLSVSWGVKAKSHLPNEDITWGGFRNIEITAIPTKHTLTRVKAHDNCVEVIVSFKPHSLI